MGGVGAARGAGDKKRILISGLQAKPQDAMRLASSRLDTPCLAQGEEGGVAAPAGDGDGFPLSQMATFANIFRRNFYGHESFSSSPPPFFPAVRFAFVFVLLLLIVSAKPQAT